MRLPTLLLATLGLLLLPACGGSGGAGGTSGELRIRASSPVLDGERTAGHTPAGLGYAFLATGVMDPGNPLGVKGVLRFEFDLPPGAEILEATLELTQSEVVGSPFTRFGDVMLHHVRYGPTLSDAGYHATPLSTQLLSNDPTLGERTVSVIDAARTEQARGATTLDFQVAFMGIVPSAGSDFVRFGTLRPGVSAESPWLRIVYRTP